MPIKRLNIPIRLNDLFKVIRFFNSREEELHVSYRDLKDQLQTDLTVTAGSSTLDGLTDVTISSVANGQVLVYDSATSQWINQTAGPATTLNGLTDVTITSVAGGQFLVYNSGTSQWENTTVTVPTTLNSLTDVTTPSPANGNVLTWDSATSQWVALAPVYSSTFAGLSDVNVAGVADENTIKYDAASSKWVPTNITPATSLNGLTDVTIGTLSNGQILVYNSATSQWENQTTSPSGVSSVTATAPITSSGGSTPNISTSMNTNKLIGRGTAGVGVMEEITLGTNLSLSGTTLNATGGGGDSIGQLTGDVDTVLATSSTEVMPSTLKANLKTGSCGVTFDGQGGVISNGRTAYVQIPYNGTLTSWTLVAAQSGSCTITVFKDTYANYPPVTTADDIYSAQPALASAIRNQNLTPTYVGSQATVTAGDWIGFTISGVTTVTWVNLSISITKT